MRLFYRVSNQLWIEIGLIFVFWLVSIAISYSVFGRPLDTHHEWLSGSTLLSLKSFESYGFWPFLGTSVKGPFSFEFFDVGPQNLPFIFSQHPSMWLISPYLALKGIRILGFQAEPSVVFLQSYNLIFTRLISTFLIFFIFKQLCFLFLRRYQAHYATILASIATFFWLFSPPVLYWTQNVYHEDQSHLTPSLFAIAISLYFRFNFSRLTFLWKCSVFTVAFCASFSSYYGWILVPFIMISSCTFAAKGQGLKSSLLSLQPWFYGLLSAIALYTGQIIYLDRLWFTFDRLLARTGSLDNAPNLQESFARIWNHTTYYFPVRLLKLTDELNVFSLTILLILLLAIVLASLYFSPYRKGSCAILLTGFVSPVIYVSFLREYSYVHDFSVLKLAFPVVALSVLLPLIFLVNLCIKMGIRAFFNIAEKREALICILLILGVGYISFYTKPQFDKFAFPGTAFNQELGDMVVANISETDLPISDSIPVGINPPHQLFYTNRFVYSIDVNSEELEESFYIKLDRLAEWGAQGRANLDNLKVMRPVYIEYSDRITETEVRSVCAGSWQEVKQTVGGQKISICRADDLREYLPWLM